MAHWGAGLFGVPLPEFGISEKVSGLLGNNQRTSQGGSNLFGSSSANTGQVAGATTGEMMGPSGPPPGYVAPTGGSGSTGGLVPTQQIQQPQQPSGGSNPLQSYIDSLNSTYGQIESNLTPWRDQQQGAIEGQYQNALQNIDLQQQQGLTSLDNQRNQVQTNQTNNLRDLAEAIRNSYQSFSNQLGAYGAGDSSASRVMLPYALSRSEAQQRTQIANKSADLLGGINERESTLRNAVMQEKTNLDSQRMGQLSELANWFNSAKMQLAQTKGENINAASQMVLQNAMNRLSEINSNYTARQNALQQWAMSNSANLNQLKQNMQATTDPSLLGAMPTYGNIPTTAGMMGSNTAPRSLGQTDDREKKQWYQV